MPRAQNAHAYVNAGFLFQLQKGSKGIVLKKPTIVYGGINPYFVSIPKKNPLECNYKPDISVISIAVLCYWCLR